jgi:hypothetical protein
MKNKRGRVLVFGLGDLGSRIAQMVAESGVARKLKLASRGEAALQWAQLLSLGTDCDVSAETVDGLDFTAVSRLLADFEPDLILQCASLLSPWALRECGTKRAADLIKAGFALQVAAHLPIVETLMRARQGLGLSCPVVNCSFPDLTHPILARRGLAPTAGIGNVLMIARRLEGVRAEPKRGRLRVIAHHAHVTPLLAARRMGPGIPPPLAYDNERRLQNEALFVQPGLTPGRSFNYLTAVTAMPLITALLDKSVSVETHAPGVLGLPGGYPITIREGAVELDLPPSITLAEAVKFNELAARADGVERIEADGSLIYTQEAKQLAAPWCKELAEPLGPNALDTRLRALQSFYQTWRRSSEG